MDIEAAHAAIRFGLGRRGAEPLPARPRDWLAGQLDGPDPDLKRPAPSIADALTARRLDREMPRDAALAAGPDRRSRERALWDGERAAIASHWLTTDAPFRERLVWFWANHFTISLKRGELLAMAGPYLREAIRPHVNGRFGDMLVAVMTHPAMLTYLDNAGSVGPDSKAGLRSRRGLNENLARESLELHTVSPASGYTQSDVTAYANILTGWSVEGGGDAPGFRFRPNTHEPGVRTLMGQSFPAGMAGGLGALSWLGQHPATYRHLATKLVRHFVADDPPPSAVARIQAVLHEGHGDLRAASLALIALPEAWRPLTKLRSPFDYLIAALRALDLPPDQRTDPAGWLAALGQPLLTAPLPNGWPDTAADWASGEALLRRADWAWAVAPRAGTLAPLEAAASSLGPLASATTLDAIRRAPSPREGLTLLLASPEFQRR